MPRIARGLTACKGERVTWHFFREDPTGRRKFRERNGLGESYGYGGLSEEMSMTT